MVCLALGVLLLGLAGCSSSEPIPPPLYAATTRPTRPPRRYAEEPLRGPAPEGAVAGKGRPAFVRRPPAAAAPEMPLLRPTLSRAQPPGDRPLAGGSPGLAGIAG